MRASRIQAVARIVAAAPLVVVPAEVAAAASSVTSGWWMTAVTPPPPDVPSDGLLVQSTATPTAYAAVAFALEDGERAESLTLDVAEGSASNPRTTLRLCPLTEPFQAAQGGTADDAPDYDCRDAVDAAPDQGSYVFDVSTLGATETLAVAVLPTGPLDRAVLEKPEVDSLATVTTSAPTPPSPSPTVPTVPTGVTSPPTDFGSVNPPPPVVVDSPSSSPEPVTEVPMDEEEPEQPGIGEVAQPPAPFEPAVGSTTSAVAQAALASAVLGAFVLWLAAGARAHNRALRTPT